MSAVLELSSPDKIRVLGSLDFDTVPDLNEQFLELLNGSAVLTVDMKGVSYSNSAGVSLLIHWMKVTKSKGKTLHVEGIPMQMHRIAQLTGVESFLPQ